MGLSLTAEQKELLKIFKIEEQYVVPAFQRPYSWEYDQCFQLYNDLIDAYKSKEDYFIGNIIIAKSDSNKDVLDIIDGQQRLITLILLLKVLYTLQPELKVLSQILEVEDWEGTGSKPRIRSDIFEANDDSNLTSVLTFKKDDFEKKLRDCSDKNGKIIERKCQDKFELNILYFYHWFSFIINKKIDIKEFTSFLLKNVYLLPIELTGKTQDEANEKALVIFETINNRGMNLEDADIFKAKLYKKSKKIDEEETFIHLWLDFKSTSDHLGIDIDDVFRYYSHIIRGKEGITSNEINLRVFFTRESYSPFELKNYNQILDDLFKILEVLQFIETEKRKETELAKWLQLIDLYSNQYPKFAVVSYIYLNGFQVTDHLISLLKSLIRYTYYSGSTSSVKFEIYNIIKQISNNQPIENYYKELNIEFFESLGRLKYAYSLLAFYLTTDKAIGSYNIDKLISIKDANSLPDDWKQVNIESIIDRLGNYLVLDIPKRNTTPIKKLEYYKSNSKIERIRNSFSLNLTYKEFEKRDKALKESLINFFNGTK